MPLDVLDDEPLDPKLLLPDWLKKPPLPLFVVVLLVLLVLLPLVLWDDEDEDECFDVVVELT